VNRRTLIKVFLALNLARLWPHVLVMRLSPNHETIVLDTRRWAKIILNQEPGRGRDVLWTFVYLMVFYPEYRSLFYYRSGIAGKVFRFLCRPMPNLCIATPDIGPGLFIQHGFGTVISARKIGENCWINQQVSVGYSNKTDCPTIGNNVVINAGAKVIGDVVVGDGSKIGANAVVVKNVPENCTVVGVPAYIVRRNGIRTNEPLV